MFIRTATRCATMQIRSLELNKTSKKHKCTPLTAHKTLTGSLRRSTQKTKEKKKRKEKKKKKKKSRLRSHKRKEIGTKVSEKP